MNDEEFLTDDTEPAEQALKESWPLPPDETVREFEEYLEEIGLRF